MRPAVYTTGVWTPRAGEEDAFVEAWAEFASWASGMPGAGTLRLARNLGDPQRFLSVVAWESSDTVRTLKGAPEFRERMGRVQKHVDTFASAELEVLTAFNAGRQLRDA
jgi:heme-degrading monooxygenase HmoA